MGLKKIHFYFAAPTYGALHSGPVALQLKITEK
jgi:hypothetical protein